MFFSSKNTIEYIRDDGLWMMLEISEEKKEKIRVKSYQKINNWKDSTLEELEKGYHALTNPAHYSDVFSRLVKMG